MRAELLELHRVDTNLLVSLMTLLDTRSVTIAAKRQGVTQSAMSQTLRRLRELFDDPLLVRVGTRMEPTPRAASLEPRLHAALTALGAALRDDPAFVPTEAERTFTVAMTDYAAQVILPPLIRQLRREAPGIRIEGRVVDANTGGDGLARGEVELALGVVRPPALGGVASSPLLEEQFACLVRHGHPLLRRKRDLRAFAHADHAVVAPRGERGSTVDRLLAERGLSRRVMLRVPYFLAVPAVVAASDLVVTLPRRIAESFARPGVLVAYSPPLPIEGFTLHQVWHERFAADRGLSWLRDAVVRAMR